MTDESPQPELIEGEDFYREGPYIVFTAKYLLKRGYCCESGCRHCPYGFEKGVGSGALGVRKPETPKA